MNSLTSWLAGWIVASAVMTGSESLHDLEKTPAAMSRLGLFATIYRSDDLNFIARHFGLKTCSCSGFIQRQSVCRSLLHQL